MPDMDATTELLVEIAAERVRLIKVEGRSLAKDDACTDGQLAAAAAAYALAGRYEYGPSDGPAVFWPWPRDEWRPGDTRAALVRAAALLLAEIERRDRAAPAARAEEGGDA